MVIAGNDRFRQIMFYFGRGFDRAAELGAKQPKASADNFVVETAWRGARSHN